MTEPVIYRKLLRNLGRRSNQWPVKYNIMRGSSQWSAVPWNSAGHFCELYHKGQRTGFSSQTRQVWWHGTNSYYLVKNELSKCLSAASDSTIFALYHLLWVLNVRVMQVLGSPYNTTSKKKKDVFPESFSRSGRWWRSRLRLYIFTLEFHSSSPVSFPGIRGSHRVSAASPD